MSESEPLGREDPQINPELLLGHYDETDAVRDRYAAARQTAAANLVSVLRVEDSEYVRRQSLVNGEYLQNLRGALPGATLDAKASYHERSFLLSTPPYYDGQVSSLSTRFEFASSQLAMGNVGKDLLADMSGVRATTIWIPRPPKEVLSIETDKYISAELERSSMDVPYILVGHRPQEDPQKMETLLMPLTHVGKSDSWGYSGRHAGEFRIGPKGNMLGGLAFANWKQSLLVSVMSTDQYMRLCALQDTLLDDGLTQEEIGTMHNQSTGDFVIQSSSVPVVRAKHRLASTLQLRDAPTSASELNSEEFDIHITDQLGVGISPETFQNFNVLEDTQRAAAMLGRYPAFESAKDQLIKNSLADPAIKLVQE